ncbi:hypothetical protein ABW55_14730 [Acinetobacter sp. C15]|uniref:hypothetical protein n=1 Tax=Acinetobacter sp. C15 TaxID=1661746 RepID=UPI0006ABA957|nr:hypothetical protein [Acinetobacter sp. C15]KOR12076.1 hypothetical protein ABW55_14730 [Acinetobacter sp. C15]
MNKYSFLKPIWSILFGDFILIKSRAVGKTIPMPLVAKITELEWDFSKNFCFNPSKISKVKDRKLRKACYQAFALYKKSFKLIPKLKLKIWRDEFPRLMKRATQTWSDHITDSFSFFAHCYKERATFAAQYECRWDLGEEL